jgi:hypothetical protein
MSSTHAAQTDASEATRLIQEVTLWQDFSAWANSSIGTFILLSTHNRLMIDTIRQRYAAAAIR